ncbi:MAG: NUDIX domain-containing protein [Pseudomonadota bacterium]
MTLGVRGSVERSDGKILLVRHVYTPGWYLPGGGVEKGETAETALGRELQEEAGIELIGQPSLVGIYSNHAVFPNDHVILYRISPERWQSCDSNHAGEIAEIDWFDPAEPPPGATLGTLRRLANLYHGAADSHFW